MLRDSSLQGIKLEGKVNRLITELFASGGKFNVPKTTVVPIGNVAYRKNLISSRRTKSKTGKIPEDIQNFVYPGETLSGPNKIKNAVLYLHVGFHPIAAINHYGGLPIWSASTQTFYNSKLYIVLTTADGPETVYLNGLVGHSSKIGCHLNKAWKFMNLALAFCTIHMSQQFVHGLSHLASEVTLGSPGITYLQWTMEHTIGNLTGEVRQHSDPYKHLSHCAFE
ncbi:hypothetical protein J132_00322 [Termitomyces sp. J132]|nr:hypothetical protein J132_00322 [Termitomyces sp. J132]